VSGVDFSFTLVGGTPWLNLLNTRFHADKKVQDLFTDEENIGKWLLQANLIEPDDLRYLDDRANKEACIKDLLQMREICTGILHEWKEQRIVTAASLAPLQAMIGRIRLHLQIDVQEGSPRERYQADNPADHALYRIAVSLIDTLSHLSPERVRQCEHEDCILYFVDTSKGGRRRWCSMETCGNRHKAAEFYARKKNRSS
jgi:predicted RNA-binding Zn ribbon-like protein